MTVPTSISPALVIWPATILRYTPRMSTRALIAALFVAVLVAVAVADVTTPAEMGEAKSKLKLVSDGKGHYVAVVPFGGMSSPTFYGDGKTFWQLRVYGGGSSGDGKGADDSFDMVFWEPRAHAPYQGGFGFRNK